MLQRPPELAALSGEVDFAIAVAVGAVAKMRFKLPDSKEWIETSGEVVWSAESKRN